MKETTMECDNCGAKMHYNHLHSCWQCDLCGNSVSTEDYKNESSSYIN